MESRFHWLSEDIVKFEVDVVVCEKFVTVDMLKIDASLHAAAVRSYKCGVMAMSVGLPGVCLLCAVWAIWLVCRQM